VRCLQGAAFFPQHGVINDFIIHYKGHCS